MPMPNKRGTNNIVMNYKELPLSEKLYLLMFINKKQFSSSNFYWLEFAIIFELINEEFIYIEGDTIYMAPPKSSFNLVYDVCLDKIREKGRKIKIEALLSYLSRNRKLILRLIKANLAEKNFIKVRRANYLLFKFKSFFIRSTDSDNFTNEIIDTIESKSLLSSESKLLVMLLSKLRLFTKKIPQKYRKKEIIDMVYGYRTESTASFRQTGEALLSY
jgi:hypothetical protein